MFVECSPMGCLSSRSTTVSPEVESGQTSNGANARGGATTTKRMANGISGGGRLAVGGEQANSYQSGDQFGRSKDSYGSDAGNSKQKRIVDIGTSLDHSDSGEAKEFDENAADEEDDFMAMLMSGETNEKNPPARPKGTNTTTTTTMGKSKRASEASKTKNANRGEREETFEIESSNYFPNEASSYDDRKDPNDPTDGEPGQKKNRENETDQIAVAIPNDKSIDGDSGGSSFEEELNMDLLRQYIAIDYEISQLEDRDALRLYHEKIEQLEQLERELDMISYEAEEVAVRSEADMSQDERNHSSGDGGNNTNASGQNKDSKMDTESNSIMSGVSGTLSEKSSIVRRQDNQQQQTGGSKRGQMALASGTMSNNKHQSGGSQKGSEMHHHMSRMDKSHRFAMLKENNSSYATIEEVFNRKIILEKERDKLKKEVEMVIVECDKLQQKYKKRDEILDKLFDGRTGNGLENHLEQQLNWLMEQKHYVDQVFYAWKRAETLTSQTCEQFASALEFLKRLAKTQNEEQRKELSKNVCNLLIKSRQDIEQAQRYNPNVDAPFFTEAETERFDKIIETIKSNSISQSDYNQMATIVQFAYKRAVSIRLWLEQILQITIARDSFELAEEYKWIAIQLRKERISLINLKLQDPPYRAMAQSIREQLASQHQRQQQLDNSRQSAIAEHGATATRNKQNEINRDSGIESDDIDIEEDIYRLLEMNKSRLEAAVAASRESGVPQATTIDSTGRPVKPASVPSSTSTSKLASSSNRQQQQQQQQQQIAVTAYSNRGTLGGSIKMNQHDQAMRERIQRRVRGEQPLASRQPINLPLDEPGSAFMQQALEAIPDVSKKQNKPEGIGRPIESITENQKSSANSSKQRAGDGAGGGPQSSSASSLTPSKLQIQLDEESRRNLLSKYTDMTSGVHPGVGARRNHGIKMVSS